MIKKLLNWKYQEIMSYSKKFKDLVLKLWWNFILVYLKFWFSIQIKSYNHFKFNVTNRENYEHYENCSISNPLGNVWI